MSKTSRLPGVYFEAEPAVVREVLPRMDIAAFVGFAASGPLNTPVVIEDIGRFHEIFQENLPLAWDHERGETVFAQLSSAVRAFFRNGGDRCWVVRVADDEQAETNEFLIPGLLRDDENGDFQAAWATARSEGSWSDRFAVNATLSQVPIPVIALRCNEEKERDEEKKRYVLELDYGFRDRVHTGDLLRLHFSHSDTIVFLAIQAVEEYSQPQDNPPVEGSSQERRLRVFAKQSFWFQPISPKEFSTGNTSPPGLFELKEARWLTRPEDVTCRVHLMVTEERFALHLPRSLFRGIQAGSWLRLEFDELASPLETSVALLQVDHVRDTRYEPASPPFSPPTEEEELISVAGRRAWMVLKERQWQSTLNESPHTGVGKDSRTQNKEILAHVLYFELWVRDGQGEVSKVSNLRFAPEHTRYWGYLPNDKQLFERPERPRRESEEALYQEVSHPRFSLAAPDPEQERKGQEPEKPVYLPLGMLRLLMEQFYQPAVGEPSPETALERNGLSNFNAELFLDSGLKDTRTSTLLSEAFHRQYRTPGGPKPLKKMHSLLPIEEVSLLSMPDAIHRGWKRSDSEEVVLSAPKDLRLSHPDEAGQFTASWKQGEKQKDGVETYTLEESTDPQFAQAKIAWEGSAEESEPLIRMSDCPKTFYFRVRANGPRVRSPWSNTVRQIVPHEPFEPCEYLPLDPPCLFRYPPHQNRGQIFLYWYPPVADAERFRLEMARDPAFVSARILYEGPDTEFSIWSQPGMTSFFRVCALRNKEKSPWSNTVAIFTGAEAARYWRVCSKKESPETEERLLTVHQAMIRLCAARGDILAVLSLPERCSEQETLDYKARLASGLAYEDGGRPLSFGALYYPWLVIHNPEGRSEITMRRIPPDGVICGSIAARTLESGAWVSPGNQILSRVVDLELHLERPARQPFYDEQVNLIHREPRGFLTLSAETLSMDLELRAINVRRLLILLRRLALREGVAYVFQPNDESFRRLVHREFEAVLADLFMRGAFAGATHEEAYRVVTDSSVNPKESIEQGRFVVELRVAPSQPLAFLKVRLVQTGTDIVLAEGA